MSRRKPSKKEFTTYDGVKMSFLGTINLAKHTWDMAPGEAFEWYIAHLDKQRRYQTIETAETYREALEVVFEDWIGKNGQTKHIARPDISDDVQAAIMFLLERGYTVSKS